MISQTRKDGFELHNTSYLLPADEVDILSKHFPVCTIHKLPYFRFYIIKQSTLCSFCKELAVKVYSRSHGPPFLHCISLSYFASLILFLIKHRVYRFKNLMVNNTVYILLPGTR